MYYYKHHIGDFDRNTRHLSRIERSIYLDLIFLYYESEAALSLDVSALCRKIVARTEEEKSAVLAVLDEFFHETPNGWFHDRCEEELAEYRKTKSQASDAGKASAARRAERRNAAMTGQSPTGVERRTNENPTTVERPLNDRATEAQRTVNETSTNHKPLTTNHKPLTKENKGAPPGGDAVLFPNVDSQVVADFKALRAKNRAPITATAMAEIVKQAEIAGMTLEAALRVCCSRGWRGFKAEWVAKDSAPASPGSASSEKFKVANLDHSSSRAAMEASMKRHNIVVPEDGDIPF
jgi:uncharacterized protein YdaU (DUF1376 family)